MEDDLRSKALGVRDRRAAGAMAQPRLRHLVLSLIGRDASISELVAESGMSMSSVHYHVTRLHGVGLLRVAAHTARPGRPIKRYTAAAEVFFVPAVLMAARPCALLERELRDALADTDHDIDGTLFFRDPIGGMSMRDVRTRRTQRRLAANTWHILALDEREAAQLAADIKALLEQAKLKARHGRQKRYLVRCAIVRRDNDGLFAP
jgi:DNA-binding transcriptional ArsR family regulator